MDFKQWKAAGMLGDYGFGGLFEEAAHGEHPLNSIGMAVYGNLEDFRGGGRLGYLVTISLLSVRKGFAKVSGFVSILCRFVV
ncbi:hypothetical protein [Neisseria iguanae]|uniref:hypothetical protein n=1 Tax=Neisseria iguanae TaxID=90242 RepID=UPI0014760D95|nr:hypothetical protein [Neisseria iguanae]